MYYEINVSRDGKHLFATSERSLKDTDSAHNLAQEFKTRFPKNESTQVIHMEGIFISAYIEE